MSQIVNSIIFNTNLFQNVQYNLIKNFQKDIFTLSSYTSDTPVFTTDECDQIIKIGYREKFTHQNLSNGLIDVTIFNSRINYINPSPEVEYIYNRIRYIIIQQNQLLWNFNLHDYGEPLKFSEYNETYNGFVDWHVDLGQNNVSKFRKLTAVVQLSDEKSYEGGDLIIMYPNNTEYKMPRKKGSIIIFPSIVMHKVMPVTRGIRNSLVTFAYGPPFC